MALLRLRRITVAIQMESQGHGRNATPGALALAFHFRCYTTDSNKRWELCPAPICAPVNGKYSYTYNEINTWRSTLRSLWLWLWRSTLRSPLRTPLRSLWLWLWLWSSTLRRSLWRSSTLRILWWSCTLRRLLQEIVADMHWETDLLRFGLVPWELPVSII